MAQQTPLYGHSVLCSARMVDFHGWMMLPLHYGSQIDEHHAVRVPMYVRRVPHDNCRSAVAAHPGFLRCLLASDVAKLKTGQSALYRYAERLGCDYRLYRLLRRGLLPPRCKLRRPAEKDLSWIAQHARPYAIDITVRDDLSLIAVRGPNAQAKKPRLCSATSSVKPPKDETLLWRAGQAISVYCRPAIPPVKRAMKLPCRTESS